ncbi:hypothetical protein [Thomasclavelia sp.]
MKKYIKVMFSICLILLCMSNIMQVSAQEAMGEIKVTDIQYDDDQATVKVTVTNNTYTSDQLKNMFLTAEAKNNYGYYYSEKGTKVDNNVYEFTLILPKNDVYIIGTDGISGANTSIYTECSTIENLPVDKSELESLINKADKLDLSIYTQESVDKLKSVLKDAKALMLNEKASQDEVNEMIKALQNAIDELVKISVTEKPGDDSSSSTTDGNSANTGDNTNGLLLLCTLIGVTGVMLIVKKNHKKYKNN